MSDELLEATWHIRALLELDPCGHAHQRPGIWDSDNVRTGKANRPCVERCGVEEDARQFLAGRERVDEPC